MLCMVAHVLDSNLRHVRTIRLWRGEFGAAPPFDTGPDTLFVAYSAWAEMTCFRCWAGNSPCTSSTYTPPIWRQATFCCRTIRTRYERSRASGCLTPAAPTTLPAGNRSTRKRSRDIGEGRWRDHGQEAVFTYCEEDVRASSAVAVRAIVRPCRIAGGQCRARAALVELQRQGDRADLGARHAHRRAAMESSAGEQGGCDRRVLRQFDPSHGSEDPIYTPDGEWSYARFENWLVSAGVAAWPRLESGQLDIDGDAFRLMYHVPGIEGLHALRDSLGVIVRAKLPIGRDGRNRPSLFPFGTATGRNAHSKSLYNAHASMRSFMIFSEDTIGVYLDWRTQEVGIAAALSGDEGLMRDYQTGDVYYASRQALWPDK